MIEKNAACLLSLSPLYTPFFEMDNDKVTIYVVNLGSVVRCSRDIHALRDDAFDLDLVPAAALHDVSVHNIVRTTMHL